LIEDHIYMNIVEKYAV